MFWRHLINIYSFQLSSSLFLFESKNCFSELRYFCKSYCAVLLKGLKQAETLVLSYHTWPPVPLHMIPILHTRKLYTRFLWVKITDDHDSHRLKQNNMTVLSWLYYSRKHLPRKTKGANNLTPLLQKNPLKDTQIFSRLSPKLLKLQNCLKLLPHHDHKS